MTSFNVISADSHVVEPANLWVDHIDAKFRDRAPHIIREKETDVFVCEGASLIPVGLMAGAGRGDDEVRREGRWEEDVPPGSYDPQARLGDMAVDGVDAEVVYPTVALAMYMVDDVEFQKALFRAYNTWVADFCSQMPGRFKGVALISTLDMEAAVEELQRARNMGLSGAMISVWPHEDRLYDEMTYEPLWAAAAAVELPVSLHIATGTKGVGRTVSENTVLPVWVQQSIAGMIFGGVFDRHPKLRIVSAEHDIGWAGNFIERMDFLYSRGRAMRRDQMIDRLPSEYMQNNVWMTFMVDRTGIASRHIIGVDRIMWSSDYPHHTATWPNSQAILAKMLTGVPDDERRMIVCENAAGLYGFN